MPSTKENTILRRGDSWIARDKQSNFRKQTANRNGIVYRKPSPVGKVDATKAQTDEEIAVCCVLCRSPHPPQAACTSLSVWNIQNSCALKGVLSGLRISALKQSHGKKDSFSFTDHSFNCNILKHSDISRYLLVTLVYKTADLDNDSDWGCVSFTRTRLRQIYAWSLSVCSSSNRSQNLPGAEEDFRFLKSNLSNLWRLRFFR